MKGKFEDIVRQKFEGASSPVPPSAWAGVSSGMATGAAGSVFSSVAAKVMLAAVISGVVITAVVFNQDENTQLPEKTTSVNAPLESQEIHTTSEEPIDNTSSKKEEKAVNVTPDLTEKTRTPRTSSLTPASKEEDTNSIQENPKENQLKASANDFTKSEEWPVEGEVGSEKPSGDEMVNDTDIQIQILKLPSDIKANAKINDPLAYNFSLNEAVKDELSVKWYVNDSFSGDLSTLNHRFENPGEHTVMALIYQDGDLKERLFETVTIKPNPILVVPNTFTPNTTLGLNDLFDIDHGKSEYIYDYEIQVYSATGALVFTSNESMKAWDGLINGNLAPEAIYTYKIIYWSEGGSPKTETGKVVLQR